MDLQGLVDAASELDEPASDVLLISARVPQLDLKDGEGELSAQAEDLKGDILSLDYEELEELAEETDRMDSVGPLLEPSIDPDTTARAKRRANAFVTAHRELREAEWDKEVYEALSDLQERV